MPGSLSAHDLSCHRGGSTVFAGLNFSAEDGDLIQVTGPNGSGKTSLLRILAGLSAPESGAVRWRETPIAGSNVEAFRRARFYIGHKNGVAGDLSATENLTLARRLHRTTSDRRLDEQAALVQLGMTSRLHVPTRKLSAGQRQRIALAKLLVIEARLWLLDEPFTALDRDGKALLENLLHEHCRNGGTAIVATHQPIDSQQHPVKPLDLAGDEGLA